MWHDQGLSHGLAIADYAQLHRWSVDHLEDFWTAVWDFGGVIAETRGERVVADRDRMPGARFFPDARLNFAENLLRFRDDRPAIVALSEDGVRRELSYRELPEIVAVVLRRARDVEHPLARAVDETQAVALESRELEILPVHEPVRQQGDEEDDQRRQRRAHRAR